MALAGDHPDKQLKMTPAMQAADEAEREWRKKAWEALARGNPPPQKTTGIKESE